MHPLDFANRVHGDHLFALLTCSARQWSTLVNFEPADPTLHDPFSVGVNTCCPTLLSDPTRKNLFGVIAAKQMHANEWVHR